MARRNATRPAGGRPPGLVPLDPDRSVAARGAEAALLGAALYASNRARQVLADLAPADLTDPRHRAVLAALRAVLATGADPTPALVLAAYARGEHDNTPAHHFALVVHDCLTVAAVPAAAPHLYRAVLEARWRRDALAAAARIADAAEHSPVAELHHVLGEALAVLGATLARLTPAPAPAAAGTRRPEPGTTAAAAGREAA